MRICLINPPNTVPKKWKDAASCYQPMGLAYIAAELLKDRHEIYILDALLEGWNNSYEIDDNIVHVGLRREDISSKISNFAPDVVGITVPFSTQIKSALEVATTVKEVNEGIYTVLGGPSPTVQYSEVVSHPDVDFVVIGEGEITVRELINKLKKKDLNNLSYVKGLAYRDNGKPKLTERRPFIQNLDTISFPARHLLPMNKYFQHRSDRWTTMITSRGCPYNCIFCSIHLSMGKKWRYRSPENVVDEIEQLIEDYRINTIYFEDDNLTLNKKRIQQICELIIERKLDFKWFTRNGVRADTLDEVTIRLMKKSGCKRIWLAPESGSQRVVDNIIKKRLDLNRVDDAVKNCKKVGMPVTCFFVIGLIGETKEDINTTIKYAHKLKKLGVDNFWFSIATPYIGTELYDQAVQKGYLDESLDPQMLSTHEALISTPEFSANDLLEIRSKAMKDLNKLRWTVIKYGLTHPTKAFRYLQRLYLKI